MAWMQPSYSRSQVNRAGATYVNPSASPEDRALALAVINNWRSSHSFPLNTLQMNLRRATQLDNDPTVAQRIKRLPSIRHKLEVNPGMKLARMQDIGGCRAVLTSVSSVRKVRDYYLLGASRMKHELIRTDDYIDQPKVSGYRGVHLVYRYSSDKTTAWNDLAIELQLRSRLQHGWATAVETVGTFTRQALKSSLGDDAWLRFFALMSSALALRENTSPVPGTPSDERELAKELREYAAKLDVVNRLTAYGKALRTVEGAGVGVKGHTFLVELNTAESVVTVWAYADTVMATEHYNALEQAIEGIEGKDVVLVSVESLAALQRAYPNYFLDTTSFVMSVREAIA